MFMGRKRISFKVSFINYQAIKVRVTLPRLKKLDLPNCILFELFLYFKHVMLVSHLM